MRGWLRGWMWVLFWLGTRGLGATDPLVEAQGLFSVGRPAEAAALLERVVASQAVSSDVWFNLGQAHFAAGDMGRAMAAWRRGLSRSPRDTGLRAALNQARQRTGGIGDHPLAQLTGWLRVEEWGLLTLMATVGLVVVWAVREWRPTGMRLGMGWWVGVQLVLAVGWLGSLQGRHWSPDAVVVVRDAAVTVAPVSEGRQVRTLGEGVEVRLLRRFGEWREVALDGERLGWMRASALAVD